MTAETAGSSDPPEASDRSTRHEPPSSYRSRHGLPWPWWVAVIVLFLALVGARVRLVQEGWLFGAGRITAVDVIISVALVVSIAIARQASFRFPLRRAAQPGASSLTDWFGVATAVLGIPALVIAGSNLLAPATPSNLNTPACTGAPAYGWDYYGVTTGPIGNYARSGPGLSFPQTDRFDSNCTLGFVGYCVGDPVEDPLAKWAETRWLLVGRHTKDPGKSVARVLSQETSDRRFVTHAYVAPRSPDSRLRYLGDEECQEGRPRPGQVTMTAKQPSVDEVVFELEVDHAERVGMAIALHRPHVRAGSAVRRVDSEPVAADGTATITWNAKRTAQQLDPARAAPSNVTILAIACLGPVGPAQTGAAVLSFTIAPDGTVTHGTTSQPTRDVMEHLRRAACDSETFIGAEPSPSPLPPPAR